MSGIPYIDRATGKQCIERVYGGFLIDLLYGPSFRSKVLGRPLKQLISRAPLISRAVGTYQRTRCSQKAVMPFIEQYGLDATEFADDAQSYTSFDSFFTRKLKPDARPIADGATVAVTPADGRFLAFARAMDAEPFALKGVHMDLEALLQDRVLASHYAKGSMVLARLCPSDYHRFHFPVDCTPSSAKHISGPLFSVNRSALQKRPQSLWQNRRMITELHSDVFGNVICVEVGATCVGSIHQTYEPDKHSDKGDEKGYFSFGGSAMVLLFPEGSLQLDEDLLANSAKGLETRCLMGQSLGRK